MIELQTDQNSTFGPTGFNKHFLSDKQRFDGRISRESPCANETWVRDERKTWGKHTRKIRRNYAYVVRNGEATKPESGLRCETKCSYLAFSGRNSSVAAMRYEFSSILPMENIGRRKCGCGRTAPLWYTMKSQNRLNFGSCRFSKDEISFMAIPLPHHFQGW